MHYSSQFINIFADTNVLDETINPKGSHAGRFTKSLNSNDPTLHGILLAVPDKEQPPPVAQSLSGSAFSLRNSYVLCFNGWYRKRTMVRRSTALKQRRSPTLPLVVPILRPNTCFRGKIISQQDLGSGGNLGLPTVRPAKEQPAPGCSFAVFRWFAEKCKIAKLVMSPEIVRGNSRRGLINSQSRNCHICIVH